MKDQSTVRNNTNANHMDMTSVESTVFCNFVLLILYYKCGKSGIMRTRSG